MKASEIKSVDPIKPNMTNYRTGDRFTPAPNGSDYLAMLGVFARQNGGFETFNAAVSTAIGGYPAGAVLTYLDTNMSSSTFGQYTKVISCIDDNTDNFVLNPSHIDAWFASATSMTVVPAGTQGAVQHWKRVTPMIPTADGNAPLAAANVEYVNGRPVKTHTHTKSQITDFAHTHTTSSISNFATAVSSAISSWWTNTKKAAVEFASTLSAAGITDTTVKDAKALGTDANGKLTAKTVDSTPTSESENLVTSGGVATELAKKAPIESPTFTGDPKAPTPDGSDDKSIATVEFVRNNDKLSVPNFGYPLNWLTPTVGTNEYVSYAGYNDIKVTYKNIFIADTDGYVVVCIHDGNGAKYTFVRVNGNVITGYHDENDQIVEGHEIIPIKKGSYVEILCSVTSTANAIAFIQKDFGANRWSTMGNFLKQKGIGYEFQLPSAYGFSPISMKVIDIGSVYPIYNTLHDSTQHIQQNTVTCCSSACLKGANGIGLSRAFGSSGTNDQWMQSSLRSWLNSTDLDGFLRSFTLDSSGNLKQGEELKDAYDFISAIVPVHTATYSSNSSTAQVNFTSDKVWIPNVFQLGYVGSSINDYKHKTFSDPSSYPVYKLIPSSTAMPAWTRSKESNGRVVLWKGDFSGSIDTQLPQNSAYVAPVITFACD